MIYCNYLFEMMPSLFITKGLKPSHRNFYRAITYQTYNVMIFIIKSRLLKML